MSVKGTVTHLILLSCLLQGVRWEVFFSIHRKTKVGKKQNHFWFGFITDYVRRDIWKVTLTILEPSGMLLMWDAATSRWRRCKEKQMRDECEIYCQALQKDWFLSHICAFKYRAAFAIYCIDIQLQNSMFWKKLFMFTQVVNCRLVACNCHFPQSEWVSRRRHCQHSWQLTTLVRFRCRLVQRCGGVTLWSVHVTCWGPPSDQFPWRQSWCVVTSFASQCWSCLWSFVHMNRLKTTVNKQADHYCLFHTGAPNQTEWSQVKYHGTQRNVAFPPERLAMLNKMPRCWPVLLCLGVSGAFYLSWFAYSVVD